MTDPSQILIPGYTLQTALCASIKRERSAVTGVTDYGENSWCSRDVWEERSLKGKQYKAQNQLLQLERHRCHWGDRSYFQKAPATQGPTTNRRFANLKKGPGTVSWEKSRPVFCRARVGHLYTSRSSQIQTGFGGEDGVLVTL